MESKDRIRVLIAEDEDSFRRTLCLILLSLEKYEVEGVNSGESAIESLKQSQFDVVILDYKMDAISGLNVLQWMHEQKMDTPVVVLTGAGSENIAVEAMKLGAYDYIRKEYFDQKHLPILVNSVYERYLFKKEKERQERSEKGRGKQLDSLEQLQSAIEFLAHFAATRLSILSGGIDELEPELHSTMPKELKDFLQSHYTSVKEELRLISMLTKTLVDITQFMYDRFRSTSPQGVPEQLLDEVRRLQESADLNRS